MASSITPGSGVVLLSTEWKQSGLISGSTVNYNEYCPVDPQTREKSLTGCTNTAAAQIIYYWLENSDLNFTLNLTEDDAYTSVYGGRTIEIDATAETAQRNGYLSFAETNQLLKVFTVGDASDIAALCFACGVVQEANYSSEATSTAWNADLFYRSGLAGYTSVGCYESVNDNPYFFVREGNKIRITESGYEVLINELLSGRPVGTSYPGHCLIFDGYDESADKFHINYGWGGYKNGWFTKDEIFEQQFYQFSFDIMADYDGSDILVTNSATYGVGTLLRGIEQLGGILKANTLTVQTTTGTNLELERAWDFDKEITLNNFNSNVYFKSCSWGVKSSADVTFNSFSGQIRASRTDKYSATAIYTTEDFHAGVFSGSLIADSKAYAAGIECSSVGISGMTGTISVKSTTGSVYGINAKENVEIEGLSGKISSVGGIYSSAAIYAEENVTVKDFSGVLAAESDAHTDGISCGKLSMTDMTGTISVKSTTGSVYGITAKTDAEIKNLRGNITVSSGIYSAAGIRTSGKTGVDTLSGTISVKSTASSAYGFDSDGVLSIDDVSGIVSAWNSASKSSIGMQGSSVDVQNFCGVCIAASSSSSKSSFAVNSTKEVLSILLNDGSIYAGLCSTENELASLQKNLSLYGEKGVSSVLQYSKNVPSNFYAMVSSDQDDTVLAKNHSTIQGQIYLGAGTDILSVSGGSYVYAPGISFDGTGILTVDSTSTVSGIFFGKDATTSMTVNMIVTAETSSDAMIVLQKYCNNFCYYLKDKTLNIDLHAAADGTFVLVDASGLDNANYLENLSAKISTGSTTFTLKCGETANNVSLKYESEKLILVLDGYAEPEAEALLFDEGTLLSVNKSVSNRTISSDGTDSLRLTNGGTADSITIGSGGDLSVSNQGKVTGTTVMKGGFLAVNSDGYAVDTTVNADGILNLGNGASHSGSLTIEEGGIVRAEDTAVIDFTLAGFSEVSYQGISDFSCIEGSPSYTVTVADSQGMGTYVLAENAGAFTGTLSVMDSNGSELGKLNVGETITSGAYSYTLNREDSNDLSFTVERAVLPTITITAGSASKKYDGTALKASKYTYTGELLKGDSIVKVRISGSQTDAGEGKSSIASYKIMRGTLDVTSSYSVTLVDGTLTVDKRDVTLTSGSANKSYDGTPLTDSTITVSGDGFASGEGYTATVTGSQTEVGSSKNTFSYTLNSGTKDENYNITTNEGTLEVTPVSKPSDLSGNSEGVSWNGTAGQFTVEYSQNEFAENLTVTTAGHALDTWGMPTGRYDWHVCNDDSEDWVQGIGISALRDTAPQKFSSDSNGIGDLFFADSVEVWNESFAAQHTGTGDWSGTLEEVSLSGKNKITDVFEGSADANILVLTDAENGDALFVDDIYSAFPEEQQSRIAQIDEIRAGAGDDIVDMTSQRFNYTGNGLVIRGGEGNDTIWANSGSNKLFGDAGNDRIVGASGDDVIAGGSGDDSMHGGCGNDIFCFCEGWGTDTVEQISGGSVTLWFADDSGSWDQDSMTYTRGTNSVHVTGVTTVSLKYGDDGSEQYTQLASLGVFMDASSAKIYEEPGKGVIASL